MILQEFWDSLQKHDWYSEMSDDHGVWQRGENDLARLRGIANESPEHKTMFEQFCKHMYSGKPWGTEKTPKPERPQ